MRVCVCVRLCENRPIIGQVVCCSRGVSTRREAPPPLSLSVSVCVAIVQPSIKPVGFDALDVRQAEDGAAPDCARNHARVATHSRFINNANRCSASRRASKNLHERACRTSAVVRDDLCHAVSASPAPAPATHHPEQNASQSAWVDNASARVAACVCVTTARVSHLNEKKRRQPAKPQTHVVDSVTKEWNSPGRFCALLPGITHFPRSIMLQIDGVALHSTRDCDKPTNSATATQMSTRKTKLSSESLRAQTSKTRGRGRSEAGKLLGLMMTCLLYTSPSPRDRG